MVSRVVIGVLKKSDRWLYGERESSPPEDRSSEEIWCLGTSVRDVTY